MHNIQSSARRKHIPLGRRARLYIGTLEEYREAKAAVNVAERLGHDARDLRFHAAEVHARHQMARDALLAAAVATQTELLARTPVQGVEQ